VLFAKQNGPGTTPGLFCYGGEKSNKKCLHFPVREWNIAKMKKSHKRNTLLQQSDISTHYTMYKYLMRGGG
jgi:hypothetical protein